MRVRNDDHMAGLSADFDDAPLGRMLPKVFVMVVSRVPGTVVITRQEFFQP